MSKKKEEVQVQMKLDWSSLTVYDQIRIKEIGELQTVGDEEKNMMVAALLAGIPYDEFLMLPLDKVREIMDKTDFLFSKPQPSKARRRYKINGRTYKLFKDPSEMTVAQYISFQQIQADGFDKRPLEMLALMLIPEGHQYNDGYNMETVMNDMGDMKITDALGVCYFFTRRCLKLIGRIRILLKAALKMQRLKAPKTQKEMIKATEIQTNLVMEELERLYGSMLSMP